MDDATLDDLDRHGQAAYVLEGLIDGIRCTAEAEVACLLKQVGRRANGRFRCAAAATPTSAGWPSRSAAAGTGWRPASPGRGTAEQIVQRVRAELRA